MRIILVVIVMAVATLGCSLLEEKEADFTVTAKEIIVPDNVGDNLVVIAKSTVYRVSFVVAGRIGSIDYPALEVGRFQYGAADCFTQAQLGRVLSQSCR